jgi:hypothetical protein
MTLEEGQGAQVDLLNRVKLLILGSVEVVHGIAVLDVLVLVITAGR